MTKKMLFIFNPHSGKGQIKNHLLDILDKFAKAEYDIKCDIGKFNSTTFNYVAAFGAFTDVPYDTPQETKNILGHTAYVLEGMKRLSSLPSYHVKIKYDNGEFEGDIFLCMILNATSVAGLHKTN